MVPDRLPILLWGPRKLLAWARQLCDVLDGRQVLAGNGLRMDELPTGRLISLAQDAAAGADNGVPGGFKCAVSGARIRVYLGLVNNVLPDGMTLGDTNPFTIAPVGSNGFVLLKVTVSDDDESGDGDGVPNGSVVSAEIEVHAITMPPDTFTEFYLAIGTYGTSSAGRTVTPGGAGQGVGDQSFELCGGLGGEPLWGPA